MIESAYIHIPFCKSICSYCDFPKVLYNKCYIDKYLSSLEREIKARYKHETLKTIYIGGGTPSSLNKLELERLFNIINILKKDKNIEYTIEANLDSLTKEKLDLFKKAGINRLSIGIESFSKKSLNFLERNLSDIELINYAKKIGITNINIDLMYALKNETIEDLKKDLDEVLKLDIKHISTYSLILEPNTKLYNSKFKPINEDLDYKMYELICNILKKNGFIHYEISNFSKPGFYSKHNMTYWNNKKYYGFGMGASGYIDNIRYTNTKSITKYINGIYDYNREILEKKDIMEYEMILGLRKLEGVNYLDFYKKFNIRLEEKFNVQNLIKEGNFYKIPEDKLYVSNDILLDFIGEE